MTGEDLRNARRKKGWTQEQVAKKLGITQAYLSMLESGRRRLSRSATRRVLTKLSVPPTALPLPNRLNLSASPNDLLRDELAALGYPGFAYLHRVRRMQHNPAQVLFTALNEPDLDMRVVEGLPWLAFTFTDLDWNWLVRNAKLHDRQNRLGFTVTLARQLAQKVSDQGRADNLSPKESLLQQSLLVKEDTYCHDSMTKVERDWLREHPTPEARQWNLLSDLSAEHLTHAPS
ncbi:MAG TPA: helix-turn-helix transcriptional regulator [Candidatus Acidoferrales bacterium]|nr:helix-turn-helix transcriptional regulator [Candidatus Acidoferrales bacterium]